MKLLVAACFLALLCGVLAKKKSEQDHKEKVKIAVYYEALCPDSKKFITSQLAPVWRDFRGAVKVKLVPYGKATHNKVNTKWQFTCQHGEDECYGNRMQACILKDKKLVDTEKVDIIICLMSQSQPDKHLDTCLEQAKKTEESNKIKRCASGEQGDNLLAAFGDKTDTIMKPLISVPTIVINEKYDQQIQDDSVKDLKSVVCRVAVEKPAICQK